MSEACASCKSDPCLFEEWREVFIATDAWNAQVDAVVDRAHRGSGNNVNRNLRKRLFREFAMWNGTMTKPPTPHPTCVVKGVRLLYPSSEYMGFKRTRNEVDNTAVDIDGEKLHGKKWVRTDDGRYEVEVEDDNGKDAD